MSNRSNRARAWHYLLGVIVATVLLAYAFVGQRPPSAAAISVRQTTPTVEFVNSVYTVAENQGPAQITVRISAAPTNGRDVAVRYRTLPGTASEGAGGDFIATTGVLTFTAATQTVQSFQVNIVNDTVVNEPNENINLVLQLLTPETAVLGRDVALLVITDDDFATATPRPQAATPTPIYVDVGEPNDSFAQAYTLFPDAAETCTLTLWPPGDQDFYTFAAKAGTYYNVLTNQLSPGLDTVVTVYDPTGKPIVENDDVGGVGQLQSSAIFQARTTGLYLARVVNKSPANPANLTYCVAVDAMEQPTPTPTATVFPARVGADPCEPNGQVGIACLFGVNQSQEFNFVPPYNEGPDNDYYKMWVTAGSTYTCETSNLSNVTDTNMIFLDANGRDFNPPLGNNDKAPGDLGSRLTYFASYTGYLHILVGPVNPVPLDQAARFTYTLACTGTVQPTAVPTLPPTTGGNGGGGFIPVQPTLTPLPTPTPIDLSALLTPSPVVVPVVTIQPLPTATRAGVGQGVSTVNVTVYYDSNFNFAPEPPEGVIDVAVALYDNTNGRLIAFGYTNQDGTVRFDSIASTGAIRVQVPLLNYSQVVGPGESNIAVRVAPLPLPIGIP